MSTTVTEPSKVPYEQRFIVEGRFLATLENVIVDAIQWFFENNGKPSPQDAAKIVNARIAS
jgi:hypothetical protein